MNPRAFLSADQVAVFNEYTELRARAWREGWHHWHRVNNSRDVIQEVEVEHCIPYTPPYELDDAVAVCHPNGRFVSELMFGGIHPVVTALLTQKLLLVSESGKSAVVDKVDAVEWKAKNGPIIHEIVVDNRRAHSDVEGPLTYEQAIEYCVLVSVPKSVWGEGTNFPRFYITSKKNLPRTAYRTAWRFNNDCND